MQALLLLPLAAERVALGGLFSLSSGGRPLPSGARNLMAFTMAIDEINDKTDGVADELLPRTTLQYALRDSRWACLARRAHSRPRLRAPKASLRLLSSTVPSALTRVRFSPQLGYVGCRRLDAPLRTRLRGCWSLRHHRAGHLVHSRTGVSSSRVSLAADHLVLGHKPFAIEQGSLPELPPHRGL